MRINYLILALLLTGCHESSEYTQFENVCQQLLIPVNKNHYYLLVPTDGCGVCVKKAIEFSKKNIENPNLSTILVSNSGKKNATIVFGDSIIPPIYIDDKAFFIKANICNGYVTVVLIDESKGIVIEFLTPNNVGFGLNELYRKITI